MGRNNKKCKYILMSPQNNSACGGLTHYGRYWCHMGTKMWVNTMSYVWWHQAITRAKTICEVLWHSLERNFTVTATLLFCYILSLKIILLKLLPYRPAANELMPDFEVCQPHPQDVASISGAVTNEGHIEYDHQYASCYKPWRWIKQLLKWHHMSVMTSQITGKSIVCSNNCSVQHYRKRQSSILLALCEGNPPLDSPGNPLVEWWIPLIKGPVMQKTFPWHDVIMVPL